MTDLILDDSKEPLAFIQGFIQRFVQDVSDRLQRVS
jgi:hypothetical protein